MIVTVLNLDDIKPLPYGALEILHSLQFTPTSSSILGVTPEEIIQ